MMRRTIMVMTALAVIAAAAPASAADHRAVQGLLEQHCYQCHGEDGRVEGDLDLIGYGSEEAFLAAPRLLEDVAWLVVEGEMPPATAPAMPEDERAALVHWAEGLLAELAAAQAGDPGPVVMPRLDHRSYAYAIRDLTGVEMAVSRLLPADAAAGAGFPNVGAAQNVDPARIEKYLRTADFVLDHARITPHAGIVWHQRPLPPVADHVAYRRALVGDYVAWFKDQLVEHDRGSVEDYLLASWRHRHRDALGLGEALSAAAPDLSPIVLANWWRLLTDDEAVARAGREVPELVAWWRELPAPPIDEGDLRARIEERIAAWQRWWQRFSGLPDWDRSERPYGMSNDPELAAQKRRVAERGSFGHIIDVSGFQGRRLYLWVGDAGDPVLDDQAEAVFWENARIRFADDRETGLDEAGVRLSTLDGEGVPWRGGTVHVTAPSVLVFTVPEGAVELRMEARADPANADASVQSGVLAEPPEAPRFVAGRFVYGPPDSRGVKYLEHDRRQLQQVFAKPRFNDYGEHILADVRPIEDVTLLLGDVDDLHGRVRRTLEHGWHIDPAEPFDIRPRDFVDAASEAQRQRLAQVEADLIAAVQEPFQRAHRLLMANGLDLPEGVIPAADDQRLAALPADDRTRLAEWREAAAVADRELHTRAEAIVGEFAARAWRRAPTAAELDQLMTLYAEQRAAGAHFQAAVRQPLRLVLCSPHFLYRWREAHSAGDELVALTDRELADRLAAFVWASLPDAELLEIAAAGRLRDEATLRAQTRRMLADPRSRALAVECFGGWLGFRDFRTTAQPSPEAFPGFDDELKQAMYAESERFVAELLRNDGSLLDLVAADYVWINERLAKHYGIDGVQGDELRRVAVADGRRGGIIAMGSLLTATSNPQRTSPVKRGDWVLATLMGIELPPPPPDVPQISDAPVDDRGRTVREQLAAHRDDPACISCHLRIDPLGIALEQFDPVGAWREQDVTGAAIDAVGETVDGRELAGVAGLRAYLLDERERWLRQACRKLLGYALGRDVLIGDRELLDLMLAETAEDGYRAHDLIERIVLSRQFRYRRGDIAAAEETHP